MAELKTKPSDQSVAAFIDTVADEQKRQDCHTIIEMMRAATGAEPVMWGSIIGFGSYHYRYKSGREGDWFLTGFAPRKQNLTLYIMAGFERYHELMGQLGNHSTGKSCLYIKRLSDIDQGVLRELVARSVAHMRAPAPV
ncbi:DUF1801 domain-containing protein [Oscillochloris sp. ZM17-4]|uniref:DUF1801 domain-containing protein n=1 Tax=Oscillochloris sp. ZM17-4 TaxID=2866714 RepID=UPI001C72A7EA|nr:DUF1801 domain-containing protein [Oscillochloris sp. ZM17-4]MBX0330054.1 DUF1801 domain-containing protein [Oscillochloris sp. ZM17-4]